MTGATPEQRKVLAGLEVAITGRLASMTREESVELIEKLGGTYTTRVEASTDLLVVGQEGWPLKLDGHLTRSLQAAHAIRDAGGELHVLPEDEFLTLIGLGDRRDGIRSLYTSEQLSRILDLPRSEIQTWVRIGLIHPAKRVRRLCYFDFGQVAGAKALNELRKAGVSTNRIRHSLEQLQGSLPGAAQSLAQLGVVEEGGELVVRRPDGSVSELSGQLRLDFGGSEEESDEETEETLDVPGPRILPGAVQDWFHQAVEHEESGRYEEAEDAYHRAMMQSGPTPEIAFNLGNVLYSQNRLDAAIQRFLQAVELDAEYVEAWNNLGNVYSEMEQTARAVEAFEQALRIQPGYADAHFNLGQSLHQAGDLERAMKHFREYLKHDPHSAWARRIRKMMQEAGEDSEEE